MKICSKIQFGYKIFSVTILRSGLARVVPTTSLGFVLRHFGECMITTGDEEPCIHLSGYLAFCQICESTDPNLRSDKRLGVLPRGFTRSRAPAVVIHSRKCLRTIPNGVVVAIRAKRERRTSAQKTLYQNRILRYVFWKKHAFFGDCEILIWWFGGVRWVG